MSLSRFEPRPVIVPDRVRAWDWRCPNCGAMLGQVIGTRVIVQIGSRQVRMPVANDPETDCPRCGETSRLEKWRDTASL